MDPVPPIDPTSMLATLAIFGTITKAVVDAVRRQRPALEGWKVQALAWAIGIAFAAGFDLQGAEAILAFVGASAAREPHILFDYVITGAAIAAGAGVIAELAGKSGTPSPVVVEVDENGAPL